MKIKNYSKITALLLSFALFFSNATIFSYAYGEYKIPGDTSNAEETSQLPEFKIWQENWLKEDVYDTGKIALIPGNTPEDLNFSWYAETASAPAIMISPNQDFSVTKIYYGTTTPINQSNGTITYTAANKVNITSYFTENKTYYYRYTNDVNSKRVKWSDSYSYHCQNSDSFSAILVGDPQIGGSGNIDTDTYRWNKTLIQATTTAPKAAFILSAGDQINYKDDDNSLRERENTGLLYPPLLRSIPIATAIGNHETKGKDYKYHFNNPNNEKNYGNTSSGCDYYFSYGNTFFIVLNSNSRDLKEHRKLMEQATTSFPKAKWRVVMFHHNIYGSGVAHSNRTSANMRILFAPLMDEYNVDIVLTGHDHNYTRSYSMLDGTAINYQSNHLTNPIGTTYFTLATATGSKMSSLAPIKQFHVAERTNSPQPSYSILHIQGDTLTIKTYDDTGKPYANDFSIKKTAEKVNPLPDIQKAKNKLSKEVNFTKASMENLKAAIATFDTAFKPTATDTGAEKVAEYYRTDNDPLTFYGYAAGTSEALPNGYSTLLDKTRLTPTTLTSAYFNTIVKNVQTSFANLKKTTLVVKKDGKKLKNNSTIKVKLKKVKKGKKKKKITKVTKVKLQVKKTPAKNKVTYSSSHKKYVTINKKGVISVRKKCKKPVKLTISFENRVFYLKVRGV